MHVVTGKNRGRKHLHRTQGRPSEPALLVAARERNVGAVEELVEHRRKNRPFASPAKTPTRHGRLRESSGAECGARIRASGLSLFSAAPFLVACLLGCISDQDRCASGFTYDPVVKACQLIVDASAGPPDSATPPADAGGSEASGPTFGSACLNTTECASASTNFCVLLPGSSSGYCSKAQCSTECPSSYRCCTCAAISLVACLNSSDAAQAVSAYGCTCT
jgi:hypothetical protein